MSRLCPYRNRVPTHIIKLMDVASRITLFLVGQNGPLSFVFKDRLQNKYKTTIGAEIKCSCSTNNKDHCIHSLYVLLKIFRVSATNPIIWQGSYTDQQLSDLVAQKHTVIRSENRHGSRRPSQQRRHFQHSDAHQVEGTDSEFRILPSDFFARYQQNKSKRLKRKGLYMTQEKQIVSQRMPLQEDSVCPICQEGMSKQMCLSYCRVGCGNNYHLQCLKVWVAHKKNEQTKITCPMCREQFGHDFLNDLKNQQIQYKKQQVMRTQNVYDCSGCGLQKIPKNTHKCLLCTSFQLCEPCYTNKKHIKHPFVKQNQLGQWHGAEQRRSNQLKTKQLINQKHKQKKTNKQLLEKLRKVQEDPKKLMDFVASSYPYVSKYISDNCGDPYHKININDKDMRCMKCLNKRMIFLRRLPCGHFIDHQCLKGNLRKGVFYCEQDGTKILKGYENLVQKQKQIQYAQERVQIGEGGMQQGVGIQYDSEFDPRVMEQGNEVGESGLEENGNGNRQNTQILNAITERIRNLQYGNHRQNRQNQRQLGLIEQGEQEVEPRLYNFVNPNNNNAANHNRHDSNHSNNNNNRVNNNQLHQQSLSHQHSSSSSSQHQQAHSFSESFQNDPHSTTSNQQSFINNIQYQNPERAHEDIRGPSLTDILLNRTDDDGLENHLNYHLRDHDNTHSHIVHQLRQQPLKGAVAEINSQNNVLGNSIAIKRAGRRGVESIRNRTPNQNQQRKERIVSVGGKGVNAVQQISYNSTQNQHNNNNRSRSISNNINGIAATSARSTSIVAMTPAERQRQIADNVRQYISQNQRQQRDIDQQLNLNRTRGMIARGARGTGKEILAYSVSQARQRHKNKSTGVHKNNTNNNNNLPQVTAGIMQTQSQVARVSQYKETTSNLNPSQMPSSSLMGYNPNQRRVVVDRLKKQNQLMDRLIARKVHGKRFN